MKSPKEVLLDAISDGEINFIELCKDVVSLSNQSNEVVSRKNLNTFKNLLRNYGYSAYGHHSIAIHTVKDIALQTYINNYNDTYNIK